VLPIDYEVLKTDRLIGVSWQAFDIGKRREDFDCFLHKQLGFKLEQPVLAGMEHCRRGGTPSGLAGAAYIGCEPADARTRQCRRLEFAW